jgi:hypothetical protein
MTDTTTFTVHIDHYEPRKRGHDDQGRVWSTFESANHYERCAICGATICDGWVRGPGQQQYVCAEHVKAEYPADKSEG